VPLVVDADAVLPLAVAVKLLEAIARRYPKVVDVLGGVEDQEFAIGNSLKIGAELADVRAIPDELGFFIRERLDHLQSITCCVTKCYLLCMRELNVQTTYDSAADSGYIYFGSVKDRESTANIVVDDPRLQGMVVIDLDSNNKVLGIEVVGVESMMRSSYTTKGRICELSDCRGQRDRRVHRSRRDADG
jgi:uncharacterized protein YuzE